MYADDHHLQNEDDDEDDHTQNGESGETPWQIVVIVLGLCTLIGFCVWCHCKYQ